MPRLSDYYSIISMSILSCTFQRDISGEDLPEDLWEERTFGKLQESHDTFSAVYDCNKKLAKNSTVSVSLFKEEVDVKVLDKCPPDELHKLMDFLNHCHCVIC